MAEEMAYLAREGCAEVVPALLRCAVSNLSCSRERHPVRDALTLGWGSETEQLLSATGPAGKP